LAIWKYFQAKKHGLFIELGTLCKTFPNGGNIGSAYLRTEAWGRTVNGFRSSDIFLVNHYVLEDWNFNASDFPQEILAQGLAGLKVRFCFQLAHQKCARGKLTTKPPKLLFWLDVKGHPKTRTIFWNLATQIMMGSICAVLKSFLRIFQEKSGVPPALT